MLQKHILQMIKIWMCWSRILCSDQVPVWVFAFLWFYANALSGTERHSTFNPLVFMEIFSVHLITKPQTFSGSDGPRQVRGGWTNAAPDRLIDHFDPRFGRSFKLILNETRAEHLVNLWNLLQPPGLICVRRVFILLERRGSFPGVFSWAWSARFEELTQESALMPTWPPSISLVYPLCKHRRALGTQDPPLLLEEWNAAEVWESNCTPPPPSLA